MAKVGREAENEFPQWANPAPSNSQQRQGDDQGGKTPLTRTGLSLLVPLLLGDILPALELYFPFSSERARGRYRSSQEILDLLGKIHN